MNALVARHSKLNLLSLRNFLGSLGTQANDPESEDLDNLLLALVLGHLSWVEDVVSDFNHGKAGGVDGQKF